MLKRREFIRQTKAVTLMTMKDQNSVHAVGDHLRERQKRLPNNMVIYTDDLDNGDVDCYNAQSKVPTPNLNKLAERSIRFTDDVSVVFSERDDT